MKHPPQTIAIAFDLNFRHATQIFRGISNYVKANRVEWRLIPLQIGFEAKLPDLYKLIVSTQCGSATTFLPMLNA